MISWVTARPRPTEPRIKQYRRLKIVSMLSLKAFLVGKATNDIAKNSKDSNPKLEAGLVGGGRERWLAVSF